MSSAWTFVSALTVCAAYFGRLGDGRECELVIYRASQVLQHFMAHSPQARQYDLILKKLSRVALGCISVSVDQFHGSEGLFWSDLFRLTPAHLQNLEEEEKASDLSTGIQDRLPLLERSCSVTSKPSSPQRATHLYPHLDDIFYFPDGTYKDFSTYTLMPEGLLSDEDDPLLQYLGFSL